MVDSEAQHVRLIDSHCHLTGSPLEQEVEAVLAQAREAGVDRVITIGTDVADSRKAVAVAERFDSVWATVGVCPHEVERAEPDYLDRLLDLADHPRVVGIGEIGLDYHYFESREHRKRQREIFTAQMQLAGRLAKPVVIHCREAFDDCLGIIADYAQLGQPVVFHCFTAGPAEVERVLATDCFVGLTGIVTFKNAADLRAAAALIPEDRLLLETDAPYCSPVPVRSKRPCVPAYLVHTAAFLAKLRGSPVERLAARTAANTSAVFRLPAP